MHAYFFVVFATETAPPRLAMAQEAENILDVSVREADPREHRVLLSDVHAASHNGDWIDDRLQQASSVTHRVVDQNLPQGGIGVAGAVVQNRQDADPVGRIGGDRELGSAQ